VTFRMGTGVLGIEFLQGLKPYIVQSLTSNVGMTIAVAPVIKVGTDPGYISNPDFSSSQVYPLDGSALNATTWDTWFQAGPEFGEIYTAWLRRANLTDPDFNPQGAVPPPPLQTLSAPLPSPQPSASLPVEPNPTAP